MNHVKIYDRETLLALTSVRDGETKAGEKFLVASSADVKTITSSAARFVLLGIPEDIGVRANSGQPGTSEMWKAALKKLCNIQHNQFFDAEKILVLGEVEVDDLMKLAVDAPIDKLRELTSKIDERVYPIVEAIVKAGKEVIVIGGGHNNAYPLLKGTSKALGKPVHCINIDPHADLRKEEGRHSGNGFTYAINENYLDNYYVIGLHENYNSDFILDKFNSDRCEFFSFEDWLKGNLTWEECFDAIYEKNGNKAFGFEFDLDSIASFPTSAATPTGFSENDARIMILHVAHHFKLKYFHITEGTPSLLPGKNDLSAKLIAYMITDYVKARTVA